LYCYVRRRGWNVADAQDLTQAFFVFLLEKHAFEAADPERGRFRSLLLASLKNFLANQVRSEQAEKRGGGVRHFSIDFDDGERRLPEEPADGLTPERLYERRWALTLLDAALDRLRQEHLAAGKAELFEALRSLLTPSAESPPYREIAERLAMTEGAVKVAVHRLRRRYGEMLRELVAQTVGSPEDVDDELRQLLSALGAT
jgi:RNA polymerase sigma-70 factor (ECF subfamily)